MMPSRPPAAGAPPPAMGMQRGPAPGQAPPAPQGYGQGPGAGFQQQVQQGGFAPPSSQPAPPAFGGAGGAFGGQMPRAGGTEAILGQFQSLTMSAGPVAPGQPADVGVDAASFPRPVGPDRESMLEPPQKYQTGPVATSLARKYSASSKFVRLATNAIPNSVELKKQWCLPSAAIIQPLADVDEPVPVVNFGVAGIIRCRQCRTYVNPFVQFVDGGRRWKCNVCGSFNEVPVEYFCTTDASGVRRDIADRPELNCGSVEYLAPEECTKKPLPSSSC